MKPANRQLACVGQSNPMPTIGGNGLDHGTCRLPLQITYCHTERYPTVARILCKRFFSDASLCPTTFCRCRAIWRNSRRFAGGHERLAQKPCTRERRQLVRVIYICFASRNVFDVPGIDHLGANTHPLPAQYTGSSNKCRYFPSPLRLDTTPPPIRPAPVDPV